MEKRLSRIKSALPVISEALDDKPESDVHTPPRKMVKLDQKRSAERHLASCKIWATALKTTAHSVGRWKRSWVSTAVGERLLHFLFVGIFATSRTALPTVHLQLHSKAAVVDYMMRHLAEWVPEGGSFVRDKGGGMTDMVREHASTSASLSTPSGFRQRRERLTTPPVSVQLLHAPQAQALPSHGECALLPAHRDQPVVFVLQPTVRLHIPGQILLTN